MTFKADFGLTAKDYATHREGFPPAFVERLLADGYVAAGERLLDVGTGTGTLARHFAAAGLQVDGLDRAPALLDEARTLDQAANVSVTYQVGVAEALPFTDSSKDVVTAGQCWHWFDAPRATVEAMRVLAPTGRIIICHFDWLPLPGTAVEATETLIMRHNPAWRMSGGTGLYPRWLTDLATGGFTNLETFSFDVAVPYTHDRWRGRIRASASVGANLSPEAVARFDAELARILAKDFPHEPLLIPHRLWAVIGRKREA